MNYDNHLTPQRYLDNKEYFDQGLIDSLDRQVRLNQKLKERIQIYQAKIEIDRKTIKALKLRVKSLSVDVFNLSHRNHESIDEVGHLEEEIHKVNDILNQEIENRDKTISELLEIIRKQDEEIGDLKRKERKNKLADTTNTNNPTSTYRFNDAVKKKGKSPINSRTKTGKKRGGQPGHKSTRSSLSKHRDQVFELHVKAVPAGAQPVYDENGNIRYYCAQIKDAQYVTRVDEYHFIVDQNGITLNQDMMNRFRINPVAYSNRLKSQVLYLQSKGVVSLNRLCRILNELSRNKLNITEGTVVNWMREFDEKSSDYRAWILEQILNSWQVHVDETGYKINGKQSWLHVMCTEEFAYFVMTEKRKDTERGPLKLLEKFRNILNHDHFKPYYGIACIHAECNGHIERYLRGGVDFDEIADCQKMIDLLNRSLRRRNELMASGIYEMDKSEYESIKAEYLKIIDETLKKYYKDHKDIPAKYVPDGIKTLRRMKEYVNEHLLFLKDFDVDFTNNAAERQCRVVKAHKKISGQCYSIDTASYLTSLLTVIQTANLQKINTLNLINEIMCERWNRPVENSKGARAA